MTTNINPLIIKVTRKQFKQVLRLKNKPCYEDYEKILGQQKALAIFGATFHEIPVQLMSVTYKGTDIMNAKLREGN